VGGPEKVGLRGAVNRGGGEEKEGWCIRFRRVYEGGGGVVESPLVTREPVTAGSRPKKKQMKHGFSIDSCDD